LGPNAARDIAVAYGKARVKGYPGNKRVVARKKKNNTPSGKKNNANEKKLSTLIFLSHLSGLGGGGEFLYMRQLSIRGLSKRERKERWEKKSVGKCRGGQEAFLLPSAER